MLRLPGRSSLEGVVITYVDDLLLTGWQHHIDAITKALLVKYVMKKSGVLPHYEQGGSVNGTFDGIDFLGARITRDADGTVWCDESKYIQHCLRENGFYEVMWLTTRTRPDIAACPGTLASLMVRRPVDVKTRLVCLWRYLWTTMNYAMCTLPSPKTAQKIQRDEQPATSSSSAQGGPQP